MSGMEATNFLSEVFFAFVDELLVIAFAALVWIWRRFTVHRRVLEGMLGAFIRIFGFKMRPGRRKLELELVDTASVYGIMALQNFRRQMGLYRDMFSFNDHLIVENYVDDIERWISDEQIERQIFLNDGLGRVLTILGLKSRVAKKLSEKIIERLIRQELPLNRRW